jgi:multiple sugar transport system substrate-binding protein
VSLRVLAWDHPRATRPLAACSEAWACLTGDAFVVETRSLTSFGDDTPRADDHDIVLIDHPHVGRAAADGAILPLDELLDDDALAALAADSAGASHTSYSHDGRQWAVAVDAACQALAVNERVLGDAPAPASWDDVLGLAQAHPGQVAVPLQPAHAISAFLSLLAARGELSFGPELAGAQALGWAARTLATLAAGGPRDAFAWEPPEALERLAAGKLICVPLVYVYVGYDVRWHDAPAAATGRAPGSILGGVGAAVLAGAAEPLAAARLAAWLGSSEVQRRLVLAAGGQPATRSAWVAAEGDPALRAVLRTLDASQVRPREAWWPEFQRSSGGLLAAGLAGGRDPLLLASDVGRLYHHQREE